MQNSFLWHIFVHLLRETSLQTLLTLVSKQVSAFPAPPANLLGGSRGLPLAAVAAPFSGKPLRRSCLFAALLQNGSVKRRPVPLCLLSFPDELLSRTQWFCQPATHCRRVLSRMLKDMIFQEGGMMQISNNYWREKNLQVTLIPRESKQNTYSINSGVMVCNSTIPIF